MIRLLTAVAVAQLGGDDERGLGALAEPHEPLVPAADHAPAAQREIKGLPARDGGVELGASKIESDTIILHYYSTCNTILLLEYYIIHLPYNTMLRIPVK